MPPYRYSPLPKGSVRLLRLLPHRDEHSRIRCHLSVCPLLDSETSHHPFEALSYTWASGDRPTSILVNNRECPVGANLYAALLHLRDRYMSRVMWVDAICINQEDVTEKGHQVQSMAKIYAKASRVIVWLGEATATSDQALEDIRMRSSQEPTAILNLIKQPWFQRIWVSRRARSTLPLSTEC